jgi:hypothetical protein
MESIKQSNTNWQQNAERESNFKASSHPAKININLQNEQNSNGSPKLKTQGRALTGVDYGIGLVSRKKMHDEDGNTIDEFDPDTGISPRQSPVPSYGSNYRMSNKSPNKFNFGDNRSSNPYYKNNEEQQQSFHSRHTHVSNHSITEDPNNLNNLNNLNNQQHQQQDNEHFRNFIGGNFETNSQHSFLRPDSPPKLTHEEINRRKEELLAKLSRLEAKGYKPVKIFTFSNSLEEIENIYAKTLYQKKLDEAIKMQGKILIGVVGFIEKVNEKYNPFDLYLSGWSESVMTDLDSYDEVFEELYEKYKDQIDMGPEVKLLGMVVMSGVYFHFSKSVLESAESSIPNIKKVLNDNPELKKQVINASAKGMQEQPAKTTTDKGLIPNLLSSFIGDNNPLMNMFKSSNNDKTKDKRVVKQRQSMDYEDDILNSFNNAGNKKIDLSQIEDPDELSEN